MTQQTGVDDLRIVDENASTVTRFLKALERADLDAALDLVTEDLVYENVSLPTIRGRRGLDKAFRGWMTSGKARLGLHVQHIATDGDVVMTDRIDEIMVGRFAARFWVYGRFTVRDGRIAIWRDHFDWFDTTASVVRGLLGLISPSLNRPQP
jgi:limonene-1,2-epoxide hydrolase